MSPGSNQQETISILMPCKDQKKEFFLDAVGSVVRQTSPDWVLLVLANPDSPDELCEWAASFSDPRIRFERCPRTGFAHALNHGMHLACSRFVSILLSDDRYSPEAVATLLAYRKRFPGAEFLHSARRHIDSSGNFWGPVMPSRVEFTMDYFLTRGSPVKHLLCWDRDKALSIGGMDEEISLHGCDDYDFPWRMAEAGARFQAVEECLYEYRLHHQHSRLTTTVPVTRQMDVLRIIFDRHGADSRQADRYLQRARERYLIDEYTDQIDRQRGSQMFVRCFLEADVDSRNGFLDAGFKGRNWFPHRVYVLPKGGPDGMKLARRMTGRVQPERMLEFVLYGLPPSIDQLPREIFYDDDLQWHQQQFALDGQVACANVLIEEDALRCYLMISDLVQRASRAPAWRTQIDNRFHGWNRLLLNAILAYAGENGVPTIWVAGSALILRNTDKRRSPKPPLYERIYDEVPRELGAVQEGDWWRLDVKQLKGRMVPLARRYEADAWPKTVCILHDTERGWGHRDLDPEFAYHADEASPDALRRMLQIEAALGVRATYSVVGRMLPEVRQSIETDHHAVAFHSWDHRIPSDGDEAILQFQLCRALDYRLKGYRLPQSKFPPGITDADFVEFNFEWLASSRRSFGGLETPRMENGLVKIPVHMDDHKMFRDGVSYEAWRSEVLENVESRDFFVLGLHDCYAGFWLSGYAELLKELQARATLITLDEVAARVTLGNSRWFEQD
jgi:glycosyltransferase involved in cell wall biosynthesis